MGGNGFKRKRLAVIGGGASGLTAAAAAALAGAKVTLFEQSRDLMPLQIGCATRALHPHIHHWPDDAAFRAVSHLPILSWTAGTAHEVALEIGAKFHEIADFLNFVSSDSLQVEHARARVRPGKSGKKPRVFWKSGDEVGDEFDIVIVAAGLGVERTANDLPLTSYWRVDALGQPALVRTSQRIVISGAGDGALIDILRATIRDFDHATFYEEVIQVLRDVQQPIAALEQKAWTTFLESYRRPGDKSDHVKKNEALEAAEPVLKAGYNELGPKSGNAWSAWSKTTVGQSILISRFAGCRRGAHTKLRPFRSIGYSYGGCATICRGMSNQDRTQGSFIGRGRSRTSFCSTRSNWTALATGSRSMAKPERRPITSSCDTEQYPFSRELSKAIKRRLMFGQDPPL